MQTSPKKEGARLTISRLGELKDSPRRAHLPLSGRGRFDPSMHRIPNAVAARKRGNASNLRFDFARTLPVAQAA